MKTPRNKTPGYYSWASMIQRCRNPNHSGYSYYGGRGIAVCDRWLQFENFITDMGERPTPKHSIERLDSQLDYEPGNVVWADKTTQAITRRTPKTNTTGYRGVVLKKYKKPKWLAQIALNGKVFSIGSYFDIDEAAWMYDQWAIALHGDIANLNFNYKQEDK